MLCDEDKALRHEVVVLGGPCLQGEAWTVPIETNLLETPVGEELYGRDKL